MSDPVDEALNELDRPRPPEWKWEKPGDTVAGVMTRYVKEHRRVRGDDGKPKPLTVIVYEIETDDGPVAIWASPVVLRNDLRRAHIGDAIVVRYLGPATTADGERSYEAFDVAVKRPEPVVHPPARDA